MVCSTTEACLQSLTVNPGVYQQIMVFGSHLDYTEQPFERSFFVSGTGVFSESMVFMWNIVSSNRLTSLKIYVHTYKTTIIP